MNIETDSSIAKVKSRSSQPNRNRQSIVNLTQALIVIYIIGIDQQKRK